MQLFFLELFHWKNISTATGNNAESMTVNQDFRAAGCKIKDHKLAE